MEWKRILSISILGLLLLSGAAAIGSHSVKGQNQPETVTFSVNSDREESLIGLAEDHTDIFMHPVDARIYANLNQSVKDELDYWESSGGYNNYFFNRAWEGPNTTAMQNAIEEGWIDEKNRTGPLYEANNENGEWEFNPFAVQEVRYAMNHLIDRQSYIEDFRDGFGQSRYIWPARATAAYQDKFKEMIESGDPDPTDGDFGMTANGDQEWAVNCINNTLMEIAQATDNSTNHFDDVTFMGELRPPSEGDSGFWEYNPPDVDEWRVVEITGAIRVQDWRKEMGLDFADQLRNQVNIQVEELLGSHLPRLSPLVFYADPHPWDDVAWHFFTGGWLPSDNMYYPHVSLRQMYAPAYGWTLSGRAVEEGHWHYGQSEMGQKINDLTYEPYAGKVETSEEYWKAMKDTVKAAVRDSVRVFTATSTDFYAYDKDSVNTAVPNAITGWDQVFGPLSLDTDKDHIDVEFYSSTDEIYAENWNRYGNPGDASSSNKKRWGLNQGSWNHPTSGKPMPILHDWTGNVETDFSYNETGKLQPNLMIESDEAVEYDHSAGKWKNLDEFYEGDVPKVASKVKYDVNSGLWHHGENYTVQDIMEWYARSKNMIYQNEDGDNREYYYERYSKWEKAKFDNIKAIRFNSSAQTYTVWGNYTFPEKSMIGDYYSLNLKNAQPVYEAISQEVYETDLSVQDDNFGWDAGEGDHHVHLMSPNQCENYTETMREMQDQNWVPPYLREENGSPIPTDAETYSQRLQSCIDFYKENDNLFISNGPYKFTNSDPSMNEIQLERFDGYTTYFDWDHWTQHEHTEPELENFQFDEEVQQGDDLTVLGEGYLRETFPEVTSYPIQKDENFDPQEIIQLKKGDEIVKSLTIDDDNLYVTVREMDTSFEGAISTEGLEKGTYELVMQIGIEGVKKVARRSATIEIGGIATYSLTVNTDGEGSVSPSSGDFEKGSTVTVEATPDEGWEFQEWTGDASGEDTSIEITMDSNKTITANFVEKEGGDNGNDDNGDGIPGFTIGLFLAVALIAVLIHKRKRR